MKKKRILAIIFAVVLVVTPLVGCGGDNGAGADGDGDGGATGNVELTFMGWEASPLETAAVEAGIAIFEERNPGITVNYTPGLAGAEYNARLITMAASNTLPDVMFVGADTYRHFVDRDMLLDITEKFDAEFPLDDFIESSRNIMDIDGRIYGISSCTVSPIVYFNKDVFDEAGIPYPSSDPANAWTIDEFRDLARELTTDDVFGVYGMELHWLAINAFILSNGGERYNEDFTRSIMYSPQSMEVLQTIKDIRVVDGSAPTDTTLEAVGMNPSQMLQTGRVAMLVDGSWALQELSQTDLNFGMAPLPHFGLVQTTGQAHLHAISANTEHPEEAWKFLQFLAGMEYQGELVRQGLWMPNRISMYEPDQVEQWYDESVHGDSIRYMLDYFKYAATDPSALQRTAQASDIVQEELEMFFLDGADLSTALQNIDRRIDEAIEEAMRE